MRTKQIPGCLSRRLADGSSLMSTTVWVAPGTRGRPETTPSSQPSSLRDCENLPPSAAWAAANDSAPASPTGPDSDARARSRASAEFLVANEPDPVGASPPSSELTTTARSEPDTNRPTTSVPLAESSSSVSNSHSLLRSKVMPDERAASLTVPTPTPRSPATASAVQRPSPGGSPPIRPLTCDATSAMAGPPRLPLLGLSMSPATPSSLYLSTHLETQFGLRPVSAAMSLCIFPSALRRTHLARLRTFSL